MWMGLVKTSPEAKCTYPTNSCDGLVSFVGSSQAAVPADDFVTKFNYFRVTATQDCLAFHSDRTAGTG